LECPKVDFIMTGINRRTSRNLGKYSFRFILASQGLLLTPLLAVLTYRYYFSLHWFTVLFSTMAVVALLSLLTAAGLFIVQLFGHRSIGFSKLIMSLGFAATISSVNLIVALATVSNALWGETLTWKIVKTFSSQGSRILEFLPIEEGKRTTLFIVLLTFCVALFFITWIAAFQLSRFLIDMQSWQKNWRNVLAPAAVGTLLSTACLVMIATLHTQLRGEPLNEFFQISQALNFSPVESEKLMAQQQEQNARKEYDKSQKFEKKNIIIIVSDALRADHMGAYDYARETTPFLSGMLNRKKVHKVETALSECSETYCGVASILGSKSFKNVSTSNFKLHELLHDMGYRTSFYLSGDHRSWNYLFDYYGSAVDDFIDAQSLGKMDINEDLNIEEALDQLPAADTQLRYFHFHLMSSHVSSGKRSEFAKFNPSLDPQLNLLSFWNEIAGRQVVDGKEIENSLLPHQINIIRNKYDNGVLQVDNRIWKILSKLQKKNYLKNSIIVVVGDHGDGLSEHGHVGHTRYLYQEDIRVPMLIIDNDLEKYKNATFATLMDIAPTLVERLGLKIPKTWEGQSILSPFTTRTTFHQTRREGSPCYAVVTYEEFAFRKFIRCYQGEKFEDEFYDLKNDPEESKNLMRAGSDKELQDMRSQLIERFNLKAG